MRLMQLRLPIRAAVKRPTATPSASAATSSLIAATRPTGCNSLLAANAVVEGHRFASVKAQGAYKVTFKKTIPKKMGAKRVGEQYVLPGTIIYKQRGTIWHPGDNTILGRDHTIHSAIAGYVKYYRDPLRHPTRQYIGVTYDRNDRLPYSPHAARKRKLGMVAIPRRAKKEIDPLTRSGLPRVVIRKDGYVREGEPDKVLTAAEASKEVSEAAVEAAEEAGKEDKNSRYVKGGETKAARAARRWNAYVQIKRSNRVLHITKNYAYRESNVQIGRLMGTHKGKTPGTQRLGSRSAVMRARRKKMDEKLRVAKELKRQQALISADSSNKNTGKKAKKAAAPAAKGKKNKSGAKKQKL